MSLTSADRDKPLRFASQTFRSNFTGIASDKVITSAERSVDDDGEMKRSKIMKQNPFYMKRIKTIIATQRSLILRLPYRVTNALGLAFQNFNPKACLWVDKTYMDKLFTLFPESLLKKPQKIRDALLNIFRIKVLDRRTLLLEEGGFANEVLVVLKGEVSFYRKTPKQEEIIVKNREPLVG